MSRSSERAPREKVGFIACAVLGGVVGRFVAQWSLPLGVAVAVAIGGVVLARRALGAQGFWSRVSFASGLCGGVFYVVVKPLLVKLAG